MTRKTHRMDIRNSAISFQLMDGRKAVGGKLELKLRLRNPILFKQIENITDKWLTIDH